MGNAVSVEIAEWIGKALLHPHRHKYQSGERDRPFIGMSTMPESEPGKMGTPKDKSQHRFNALYQAK